LAADDIPTEVSPAISHYFVMDWAAVWLDILGGLLIAGALAAWVPNAFWHPSSSPDTQFSPAVADPTWSGLLVCSVGNIPLGGRAVERRH